MQTSKEFFCFPRLANAGSLRHAVSSRRFGTLKFQGDDESEAVRRNRDEFAKACGFNSSSLVVAQQPHGTRAAVITDAMRGQGAHDFETALPWADALVTTEKNLPLLVYVADCAPLLLADETAQVLAVVHAGWRGAVGRVVSQTVATMQTLGANSKNIAVGIGPHLCAACFEIGEEVADATKEIAPDAVLRGGTKPHLDLEEVLRADLESANVQNIETMNRCPRCENDAFFSHRAEHGNAGRFGLVAWWE